MHLEVTATLNELVRSSTEEPPSMSKLQINRCHHCHHYQSQTIAYPRPRYIDGIIFNQE